MKNESPTLDVLHTFMAENNYKFCEPKDFSVFYNLDLSKMSIQRKFHWIYLPKLKSTIKNLIS
jgi:hypothetical protein